MLRLRLVPDGLSSFSEGFLGDDGSISSFSSSETLGLLW